MILCFFTILMGVIGYAQNAEIVIRENEEEILRNRINEYWQYKINGKIDKSYLCEHPEYRERVSLLEYLNQFKLVKYHEAEVLEMEMKVPKAEITVRLIYTMFLPKAMRYPQDLVQKKLTKMAKFDKDVWFRKDGDWYHLPEGFEIAKN